MTPEDGIDAEMRRSFVRAAATPWRDILIRTYAGAAELADPEARARIHAVLDECAPGWRGPVDKSGEA